MYIFNKVSTVSRAYDKHISMYHQISEKAYFASFSMSKVLFHSITEKKKFDDPNPNFLSMFGLTERKYWVQNLSDKTALWVRRSALFLLSFSRMSVIKTSNYLRLLSIDSQKIYSIICIYKHYIKQFSLTKVIKWLVQRTFRGYGSD